MPRCRIAQRCASNERLLRECEDRLAHPSAARANRIEQALDGLLDAAQPYVELAAPHEQLFNGADLRRFDALAGALNEARCALGDS